ncbi:hypothetical protein H0H92_002266 [Tricholoma furcatifolium]|nr:hypothetical protein H0H92_002266 [Tricholoma furcatifolium]
MHGVQMLMVAHQRQDGDWHGSGKPPAEYIKTDGCGFINELALKRIAQALDLASRPTAVQGRIEGAKGLWILHPHDHSPVPKIWIRKSQQKINYPRPRHRAHRILDLVRVSCASSSVHLSKQVIMNLSHNGVAAETLTELMREGLVEAVRPLMKWEGPQAMQLLWDEINKLSSVSRSRLTRLTAGLSRALGLEHHSWRGEVIDLEKDEEIPALEDDAGAGAYTGRGGGGAPVTLSEVTVELLQAGFHPTECRILREKLRYLVTSTINSIVEKYSIPVPQSLEAFIIPDPIGILEEGEVYYHSSVPLLNPESQTFFHVVSGELLVGRHPVRLASDIQKVTAVDRPELFAWVDVLIVSTKGRKSFASKLSGGDTLFILRERELVVPFVNKPVKPVPSTVMSEAFEKQPERVSAFAKRVSVMDPRAAQAAFVDILMGSLDDTKMGLYSSYQDYAIYEYGYEDPRAERLAYLFNAILDSSKTGDRLKKNIFEKDRKLYGKTIPTFEEAVRNTAYIFHTLQRFGQAASRDLLSEYNRLLGDNNADNADQDLLRPYNLAASRAEQTNLDISLRQILQAELKQIRDFVDAVYLDYTTMMSRLRKDTESSKKPASKSKEHGKADALKAPIHELYNRPVKDVIFLQNVEELKASYAYQYKPWFAFEVAFSTLCTLKAKASSSGLAPITRSFDEAKSIPSVYVRAVARLSDSDS